jgi:hypothetical protein
MRIVEKMRNANVLRIVQLMLAMILLVHWVTCFWSLLARLSPDVPWVFDRLDDEELFAMDRYQYGYVLSLTLMVCAFPVDEFRLLIRRICLL